MRGAHLQRVGVAALVGLAKQHVKPVPPLAGIEGLPLRVDHRPVESHPRRRRPDDVIGALADLVRHRGVRVDPVHVGHPDVINWVRRQLFVGRRAALYQFVAAHAPHPRKDLAGHQKRIELGRLRGEEVFVHPDKVVLVAAKGVPAKVVHRVRIHVHHLVNAHIAYGLHDHPLARAVLGNQVPKSAALGRGVFQVAAHRIDIKTAPSI